MKQKFPTQQLLKKYPHKKIAGKNVFFMSNKNLPSMPLIKNVYNKIGDNKKIPLVFETKKQYVRDYIKNQEQKWNYVFPSFQKKEYEHNELQNMQGVVSRYTTKKNKYIEPRVVMFTDVKLPPKEVKKSILHEYAHEKFEREGKKFPSRNVEEIKAEQYAQNRLQQDTQSKNGGQAYWNVLAEQGTIIDATPREKKQIRHYFEKNPELLAQAKNLAIGVVPESYAQEHKSGYFSGLYAHPKEEQKQLILKDYPDYKGPGDYMLINAESIFPNQEIRSTPQQVMTSIPHELKHREQYMRDPEKFNKELKEYRQKVEERKKFREESIDFLRSKGISPKMSLWEMTPKEYAIFKPIMDERKESHKLLPGETEAYETANRIPERKIKPSEEIVGKVFSNVMGQDSTSKDRIIRQRRRNIPFKFNWNFGIPNWRLFNDNTSRNEELAKEESELPNEEEKEIKELETQWNVDFSPYTEQNWQINKENVLLSKPKYEENEPAIKRFMYEPKSKKFIMGGDQLHANLLHSHKTMEGDQNQPGFDDYVRGIYSKDKNKVFLRTYWKPQTPYDQYGTPEDLDRNFKMQTALANKLRTMGVPETTKVQFDVDNRQLIREFENTKGW